MFTCLVLLLTTGSAVFAQVDVSATSGTATGSYTTLGAAFAAINNGTHSGEITLSLSESTTETSTAVLYHSGYNGTSSYSSVIIFPSVAGLSITGNLGSPLIDLNGADGVTIDGSVGGTGNVIDLEIVNQSTSGGSTSAIRFVNGATYNTVRNCILRGSSAATDGGVVIFGTSSVASGNSFNTLDHNGLTHASSDRPQNILYSSGSSDGPNVSNLIRNNHFYDFLGNSGNRYCGILLALDVSSHGYNSDWTITGNSFYETSPISPGSGGEYRMIYINTRDNENSFGGNFTVTNNSIGGSAPDCSGTFVKTNGTNSFWGIQLQVGTGIASNIQGNILRNIRYCNDGGADWWGIYVDWGSANIGTTAANYIGSSSDTGSIFYSCGGYDSRFLALHLQGDGTIDAANNVIGSITTANTNPDNATGFWGIHQQSRYNTNIIRNNTIGSATTARSIQALSPSLSDVQRVIGFSGDGNQGTVTLSGNTVANLYNGTTNADPGAQGKVYGIYAFRCANTISGNAVHDLSISNANTTPGPLPWNTDNTSLSAAGIVVSVNGNFVQTVSGNTVYNIANTRSDFAGSVAGVYLYGISSAVNVIEKNFIHSLTVHASSSAAIYGICIAQGVSVASNNIVTLGGNTATTLYGIYESGGNSNSANSLYFNTVYLNGSPASGNANSYCLYSAINGNIRNFRNNILGNARSNAGASGSHYALYVSNTGGDLTCDYNDYYVPGTGGIAGYYGTDKTGLPVVTGVTGNDARSKALPPEFADPGATTPGSYFPSTLLLAAGETGIETDFDGTARSAHSEMGAYDREVPVCVNPDQRGTIASDQAVCPGFYPDPFTSTLPASGHSGMLEYKWQLSTTGASSGFTDIASSNAETLSAAAVSVSTWYKRLARVECETDWAGAAESNVLAVTVGAPSYVPPDQHVSDLQAEGTDIRWYSAATGGTAYSSGDVLVNGRHYFASQTVSGVESLTRLEVVASIDPTPCAPAAASPQSPGAGATIADLTTLSGQNIRWYTVATGGTALSSSTLLLSGTYTYYASQTVDCTESATRTAVVVVVP